MGIEIIGKLTQKNNGDFKLVDLENVDYDGTGKSAKQELEKKIEEAKNSSTPYDDSAIKADIQTLKTNEVNLVEDETSMEGIKDNEYPTLTTTDKTLIGSINEVNAQYKDIANKIEDGNLGNSVEPALMDIPRIYFSKGTLPTTKTSTTMKFDYYSKTHEEHGYVDIKCQGNSSMAYPKKNFTIKLFKEQEKINKLKMNFKGWGKQSKFVLKANWIDITHARNIVSARLWGDVIKTRSDYTTAIPELLRTSPNQGAIDGFPVLVYSNGVYQGRYTLNIPKDKWMSNMDDTLDTHCILCGENYVSGCFRALPQINGSDWTDELHDTVPDAIKTSWTNAINFVMTSSDDEFKANLSNYFDVNSLIDYLLYSIISTNLDGYGKNQLYFTYDGVHWMASVYDLDSTWGLWWNGGSFVSTTYSRKEFQDHKDGQGNQLYDRLEKLFIPELKARYTELRKEVLSASHIMQRFEEFIQICPKDIVQEDYASTTGEGKFTGIPSTTTNNIQQIRTYINARLIYADKYINSLIKPVACTSITLDESKLSFTSTNSQTLTPVLIPADTTDEVIWSVNPTEIVKVNNGVVVPLKNGECIITATCGTQSTTCNVTVTGITQINSHSVTISKLHELLIDDTITTDGYTVFKTSVFTGFIPNIFSCSDKHFKIMSYDEFKNASEPCICIKQDTDANIVYFKIETSIANSKPQFRQYFNTNTITLEFYYGNNTETIALSSDFIKTNLGTSDIIKADKLNRIEIYLTDNVAKYTYNIYTEKQQAIGYSDFLLSVNAYNTIIKDTFFIKVLDNRLYAQIYLDTSITTLDEAINYLTSNNTSITLCTNNN